MDIGRKADLVEVEKGLKHPDPVMRKNAKEAGDKIKAEQYDGWVQDARRTLIKEIRQGRTKDTTYIRDEMKKKEKMGIGRTSFTFHIPAGIFKNK